MERPADPHEIDFHDTAEEVERAFRAQRRLSFTYGAIFFTTILLIPILSYTSPWWYAKPIWGGFTWNYLVVAVLYHVFYFAMGWMYVRQANALDDELFGTHDVTEPETADQ